jgi:(1->4)-alpha-D-glucan 1-alpha-D-glucosylmutase
VPDIYQGTELWDFSLVDPDNRRPVDFAQRRRLLEQLGPHNERPAPGLLAELMQRPEDGRVKMLVLQRGLSFRRTQRPLFEQGRYEPVASSGVLAEHLVSFARVRGEAAVVVVTGRHFLTLAGGGRLPLREVWRDTRLVLPESVTGHRFRNVLTGETLEGRTLAASEVLAQLPVALLEALPG